MIPYSWKEILIHIPHLSLPICWGLLVACWMQIRTFTLSCLVNNVSLNWCWKIIIFIYEPCFSQKITSSLPIVYLLPEICLRYTFDIPSIFIRYAWDIWDMPDIRLRYTWDMHNKYMRYTQNKPGICLRYSWDLRYT